MIDRLPLEDYRYRHSTQAEILWRLGRIDEARAARNFSAAFGH